MLLLLIVFTVNGLLLAGLSVPLILRKIGPNGLYGFRVKKTLEDPAVWYPVNAYAARRLLVVGLAISVSANVLFFVPGIDVVRYALGIAGIALLGLLVAILQSFLYLRSFPGKSLS